MSLVQKNVAKYDLIYLHTIINEKYLYKEISYKLLSNMNHSEIQENRKQ